MVVTEQRRAASETDKDTVVSAFTKRPHKIEQLKNKNQTFLLADLHLEINTTH